MGTAEDQVRRAADFAKLAAEQAQDIARLTQEVAVQINSYVETTCQLTRAIHPE